MLKLIKVPFTYQATTFSCGAAALQSVLFYYGLAMREKEMAEKLHTNPEIGTKYKSIIELARTFGFNAEGHLNMTIGQLEDKINENIPVIVLIQAWAKQSTNYHNNSGNEHYVVAIGFDRENFYFMDPYTLGNYTYIPRADYSQRWHGREGEIVLEHLGIIITGKKGRAAFNPAEILKLE
ncbi:MAG: hypothetical protein VR72_06460 [Clostridiaceae bacterium BRH_c20a]|nr:MAG: hypothetical protein VR72_06460 [Clostridiaceae bacterium BRH_c20a]